MAFSSNSGNNQKEVNVNTRSQSFYNSEGFCPSVLVTGYWNSMISLKIHPALDKDKRTNQQVFNYEEVVSTVLTTEKATTLLEKVAQEIIPAMENKQELSRGVTVGGNNVIEIGTKKIGENMVFFLGIHKGLHAEKMTPETSIYYEFRSSYVIKDYNPESGQYSIEQGQQSEFLIFLGVLRSAVVALTNAVAHSSRHVDKFYRDKVANNLNEIGGKLGLDLGGAPGGNNRYKSRGDVFGGGGFTNNQQQQDTRTDSEVSSTGDISDLEGFGS